MKNPIIFALFCLSLSMFGCGDGGNSGKTTDNGNESGRETGSLYGECYPNETCNKGLKCDVENNICLKEPGKSEEQGDFDSETEESEDKTDKDSENSDNSDNDSYIDTVDSSDSTNDKDNDVDTSDTSDSKPDNDDLTDTEPEPTNPCVPNPCSNIAYSNSECIAQSAVEYVCKCDEGYYWWGSETGCREKKPAVGNICTGQAECYSDTKKLETCPAEDAYFFGQDAQYTSECAAQNFTVEKDKGIVVDNNTNLVWEKSPSTEGYTWDDASNHCSELNSSNYGGKSNWRIPNPLEFLTIVDISTCHLSINSNFAEMQAENIDYLDFLWTSKEFVKDGESSKVFVFNPYYGYFGSNQSKTSIYRVLCVSGNELVAATTSDFTTSLDGKTVTDNITSLMWQKEYVGCKTWQDALKYCEDSTYVGYSDWRLPNKNELASLVTPDKSEAPYSNFSDMPSDFFWSSSSSVGTIPSGGTAWHIDFGSGSVSYANKLACFYVRCVRNAD